MSAAAGLRCVVIALAVPDISACRKRGRWRPLRLTTRSEGGLRSGPHWRRTVLIGGAVLVVLLAPVLDMVTFGIHEHLTNEAGTDSRVPDRNEAAGSAIHECEHSSNAWAMSRAQLGSPLERPESFTAPGMTTIVAGIAEVPSPPPRVRHTSDHDCRMIDLAPSNGTPRRPS